MNFSKENAEFIKNKIIENIESTFPEDKKSSAIEQIKEMNSKELERFLIQNNLVKLPGNSEKCVFCDIVSGQIPSVKISENEKALAVLEINPFSDGHTIIIPKEHKSKNSTESEELAKQTGEKIKRALSAKKILIEPGNLFGHAILNVIPVYRDEIETERKRAEKKDLEKIKDNILKEKNLPKQEKSIKYPEKISDKASWFPKRIP